MIILSHLSRKRLFILIGSAFFVFFSNGLDIVLSIEFIDGSKGGPSISCKPNKKPLKCTILFIWNFESFILADEPFAKALQIFDNCVLVNNSLYGKLVSILEFPIKFDESFKITSVPFFIPDINFLKLRIRQFYI